MTNVTAGDCHSIAYSTEKNLIYRWGLYRNALSGKAADKITSPELVKDDTLNKLNLKKVVSGDHHTLALAGGRVFGWGDPETGKIGRLLKTRRKNTQSLKIESIGLKKVQDIFCGTDTSFAIALDKKGTEKVYSWGLNNWGQLGIGHQENESTPTEIKEFRNLKIKMI
jgi:regulator of chromosome condensation